MQESFEELVLELKPFLKDYLLDQGVEFKGKKFYCITPQNHSGGVDNHPSAQIAPNGLYFKCFSCQSSGDIYTACHLLEGKPLAGSGFMTDNVFYLANKFGVLFDPDKVMDERMRERYVFYNVMSAASNILSLDAASKDYAIERGWKKKTCQMLGIGTISEAGFITRMERDIDIEKRDLLPPPQGTFGLLQSRLFGREFLTFTMYNDRGQPVGFMGRDINFRPPAQADDGQIVRYPYPKYRNSADSLIFSKSKTLNGIHLAIQSGKRDIFIFEGIGSWVTAWQAGLDNSCTTCGTAITPGHLEILTKHGIRTIHFCPDADQAGNAAINAALKQSGNTLSLMNADIVRLPQEMEDNDADFFIQTYGLEAFLELPRTDIFQWKMDNEPVKDHTMWVIEMCEFIGTNPNPVSWGSRIKLLAERSGIDESLIKSQVEKATAGKKREIEERETFIVHELTRNLHRGEPIVPILEKALEDLDIAGSERTLYDDAETTEDRTAAILKDFQQEVKADTMWVTGWDNFNKVFDGGIPKQDCVVYIAGQSQHGKSAWINNLVVEVCVEKRNRNLSVYYMTIDDSWRQVLPKIMSCYLNGQLSIRQCRYASELDGEQKRLWCAARDEVMSWIASKRLIVTDHTQSDSFEYAVNNIKSIRQRHGDRDLLFILDNFHKLQAPGDSERTKFKYASEKIHAMTSNMQFTAVCTAELNKESHGDNFGRRPRLKDITETGKIEYDANVIGMVYTELQAKKHTPDKCRVYWEDEKRRKQPVLEMAIEKNKVTGVCTKLYYKLEPLRCLATEAQSHEVVHRID